MPSFIKYKKFLILRFCFFIIIVIQNYFFRNLPESFLLLNFYEIFWDFSFRFIFCGSIIIFDFLLFQNCFIRFGALFEFSFDCYKLWAGDNRRINGSRRMNDSKRINNSRRMNGIRRMNNSRRMNDNRRMNGSRRSSSRRNDKRRNGKRRNGSDKGRVYLF
jgi:hypothetical protein